MNFPHRATIKCYCKMCKYYNGRKLQKINNLSWGKTNNFFLFQFPMNKNKVFSFKMLFNLLYLYCVAINSSVKVSHHYPNTELNTPFLILGCCGLIYAFTIQKSRKIKIQRV